MAAENSNRSILKTYTSTRKNAFTIVTLPSLSISGAISAKKMYDENLKNANVCNFFTAMAENKAGKKNHGSCMHFYALS